VNKAEFDRIHATLDKGRSPFRYYRDFYALYLLSQACQESASLSQLRSTPLGKLLNKPAAQPLLSMCGDGKITPERINYQWQEPSLPFLITAGCWHGESDWSQVSRKGCNLVLRLNFTAEHDRTFRRLLRTDEDDFFGNGFHPIMKRGDRSYYRETLAWARLDVDLERGEVLIEEIQSDWVRDVNALKTDLKGLKKAERYFTWYGHKIDTAQAQKYIDHVFSPYAQVWDQAMLCATIRFCVEELKIRQFWYHTWETGAVIKRICRNDSPPKSLYSRLPKQFCFKQEASMPDMLKRRDISRRIKKSNIQPQFFRLAL